MNPVDRFVIETGSGTVAHIVDTETSNTETDPTLSLGSNTSGERMCSRGYRDFRRQQVPFTEFISHQDIDKSGFEGEAPDEICSYCWSNTQAAIEETQQRGDDEVSERPGTVGYRLRWKQKGRAHDEWYDIVVRPATTMAEVDSLVCRFTTLDDFHLRLYGLEDEYLDSSLNVLPDHQYEQAGNRSHTKASEMTVGDVAEAADLREGDRLSLVYDFGTPSHYYCIVKAVYEPDRIDAVIDDSEPITATETAAIVREKRP